MHPKIRVTVTAVVITAVLICAGLVTPRQSLADNGLVTIEWLSKHLNDKGLVILDVRTFPKYIKSHIPGAIRAFGPWQKTNAKFIGFMTPPVDQLENMLRDYGVSNDSLIIIYDQGMTSSDTSKSARALWTLHYLGHSKCAILNGGFNAWEQKEKSITAKPTVPMTGTFKANVVPNKLITLDDVKRKLGKKNCCIIVDLRQPHEHFGHEKKSYISRFGHLRGSLLMPAAYMTIGGQDFSPAYLRSKNRLKQMVSGCGIPANPNVEIIVYSNKGLDAALGYFVLNNILGYKNVRLFDGSMLEASKDKDVPITRYSWGWNDYKTK